MLNEVLGNVCKLSPELIESVTRTHSKYNITREQFDTFVQLVIESAMEAGMRHLDIKQFEGNLQKMHVLFSFSLKDETLSKLRNIKNDLSIYSDYADICEMIQKVEERVANKM